MIFQILLYLSFSSIALYVIWKSKLNSKSKKVYTKQEMLCNLPLEPTPPLDFISVETIKKKFLNKENQLKKNVDRNKKRPPLRSLQLNPFVPEFTPKLNPNAPAFTPK